MKNISNVIKYTTLNNLVNSFLGSSLSSLVNKNFVYSLRHYRVKGIHI